LDYWIIGLLDYWIIGLLDYWIIGLLDYWIIGLLDYWIIGLLDYSKLKTHLNQNKAFKIKNKRIEYHKKAY